MNPTALGILRAAARRRAGIELSPDKDYLVQSRMRPVLIQLGFPSIEVLAERVRTNPGGPEESIVVDALTTNETHWFRDHKPFVTLRQQVLPDVMAQRCGDRELSIWSAACSTGQEPYSLAMIVAETPILSGWRVRILGTDISPTALAKAKSGTYSGFEMGRGLTPAQIATYFDPAPNGEHKIKERIRNMVEFAPANLIESPPMGPFDIVLLRNVLIYFDMATRKRVFDVIERRCRPGAWLLLGGAETTIGITDAFEAVPGERGLYRLAKPALTI